MVLYETLTMVERYVKTTLNRIEKYLRLLGYTAENILCGFLEGDLNKKKNFKRSL